MQVPEIGTPVSRILVTSISQMAVSLLTQQSLTLVSPLPTRLSRMAALKTRLALTLLTV